MAERTLVDLIEDWQTGALFVFGSVLIGAVLGWVLATEGSVYLGFGGFVVGTVLGFLLLSYLWYGR